MAKIYQKREKRARNEEYEKKYKKQVSTETIQAKKELRWAGGPWANWCRTKGHPKECSCAYR